MTENMPILLPFGRDRGDAVALDIEMPRPGRDVHENPRRRVFREIAEGDRVDRGKLLDRRAIDIAFEDVIERRSCCLQAKLQLVENEFGLALYRSVDDLTRRRI